jgi:hypothetical protein
MTQRELERQLRTVHPYRERSRRRRQALVRTKRTVATVMGVMFGLGLVATLAAFHMASQDRPALVGGQTAAWGRTHAGGTSEVASETASLIFQAPQRPYNPLHDPRQPSAERWRRAYFWR